MTKEADVSIEPELSHFLSVQQATNSGWMTVSG